MDMMCGFRKLVSLSMAAAIFLASGATGYATYATHDGHVALGHALGQQADNHDHHHGGFTNQVYILLCDIHGSCDEEPGESRTHVHVSYFGSPAVSPGDAGLAFADHSEVVPTCLDSSPLLDSPLYPLLRPPRLAL